MEIRNTGEALELNREEFADFDDIDGDIDEVWNEVDEDAEATSATERRVALQRRDAHGGY